MAEKTIQELLNFSILNIDKPSGPTSFSVSDYVRKELGLKKTSHFGTLDPMVTGVLPVALGRACKLTGFFLGHDKEYVGVMHTAEEISIEELQKIINEKFLGKIKQLPPKKSRVKRQIREREILSFEILEQDDSKASLSLDSSAMSKNFLFKTKVQGGTYIRKLVHDLGENIGGSHMTELRRTQAGIFSENDKEFSNLYKFTEAVKNFKQGDERLLREMLIPAEDAIKKILPIYQCKQEDLKKLLTGKPIFKSDLEKSPQEERFAVFLGERFVGIYKKVNEGDIIGRAEWVFN